MRWCLIILVPSLGWGLPGPALTWPGLARGSCGPRGGLLVQVGQAGPGTLPQHRIDLVGGAHLAQQGRGRPHAYEAVCRGRASRRSARLARPSVRGPRDTLTSLPTAMPYSISAPMTAAWS